MHYLLLLLYILCPHIAYATNSDQLIKQNILKAIEQIAIMEVKIESEDVKNKIDPSILQEIQNLNLIIKKETLTVLRLQDKALQLLEEIIQKITTKLSDANTNNSHSLILIHQLAIAQSYLIEIATHTLHKELTLVSYCCI